MQFLRNAVVLAVILVAVLAGLAVWLISAVPAVAQQGQCGPRDAIIAHLATKYSETRRSVGLAANNTVMEVFASTDTGSWTITVATAQGMTCLVASGQDFVLLDEPLPPPGEPG